MFHFPTFPPHTLYIQMRVTTHDMSRGSPIRTPSDHRSFTNSPRLIAGYNVLHRLLMPRHPPCALEHSHTPPRSRNHAPGASESDNTRNTTTKSHRTPHTHMRAGCPDARVHYTILKQPADPTPHTDPKAGTAAGPPSTEKHPPTNVGACSPRTQQRVRPPPTSSTQATDRQAPPPGPEDPEGSSSYDVPPMSNHPAHTWHGHGNTEMCSLLRKEVIQPHLPVRLPCYDLVPITSPTFDGSPHKG